MMCHDVIVRKLNPGARLHDKQIRIEPEIDLAHNSRILRYLQVAFLIGLDVDGDIRHRLAMSIEHGDFEFRSTRCSAGEQQYRRDAEPPSPITAEKVRIVHAV